MFFHLVIDNGLYYLFMSFYLKICIVFVYFTLLEANQLQKQDVPKQFAFITVTNARGGLFDILQKHIDRYASMKCDIAIQLNIVWNSEIQPSQTPIFTNKQSWFRPVYILKTSFNSMDWRYKIPSQSKASVYFSVDDDISISCQQLTKGFKIWQQNAIGNLAPIVSFAGRYFQYTEHGGINYGRAKQRNYFTIGLAGVAFLSRHYMELYYSKLQAIEEMRVIVKQVNNCDDIAMNFLVQYYYPQMMTIVIESNVLDKIDDTTRFQGAQSMSSDHYPKRNRCLKDFTSILGIMPLRYRPLIDNFTKKQIRNIPLMSQTVIMKQRYLDKLIKKENIDEKTQIFPLQQQQEQLKLQKQISNQLQVNLKQLQSKTQILKLYNKAYLQQIKKDEQFMFLVQIILALSVLLTAFLIYKLKKTTQSLKKHYKIEDQSQAQLTVF